MEGFTTQEDQEMLSRIEKQLKRRFAIGSQVSEHSIVQDFTKQVSLPNPGSTSQAQDTEGVLLVLLVWFPLSHHIQCSVLNRGVLGWGCLSHCSFVGTATVYSWGWLFIRKGRSQVCRNQYPIFPSLRFSLVWILTG